MSQERYPLAALLEQRGALREQARRAVADALGRLGDRERERDAAKAARSALAAEHLELAGHLYDPDEAGLLPIGLVEQRNAALSNVEERLRQAERQAEASQKAVAAAEAEVAARRQDLVAADRELQAAQKHHARWSAERQRERVRREERQSEEVTLARIATEAASDEGADQGRAR